MTKHKHYDAIIAFANGAQIEGRPTPNSAWTTFSNPTWETSWEYRVKPEENEPWTPKDGEAYYYWNSMGEIEEQDFHHRWPSDADRLKLGNCFRTRKEAKAAIKRIRTLLKDELKTSAQSTKDFQLDGKPLSEGEKALIKAIRIAGINEVCEYRKSVLVQKPCSEFSCTAMHIAFLTNRVESDDKEIVEALKQIKEEMDENND